MAQTSTKYGGSYTTIGAGIDGWSSLSNACDGNDGTYATAVTGLFIKTLCIHNFGFTATDVPSGATIDGIYVGVKARDTTASNTLTVSLCKSSGPVKITAADDHDDSWPSGGGWQYYGGAADDWNASLTQADVIDSDFGVTIDRLIPSNANGGRLYEVSVRIDYTAAGTTTTSRVAHEVELDAADDTRVTHDVELEADGSSRVAHDVELDAETLSRVAHWVETDKPATGRVGHNVSLINASYQEKFPPTVDESSDTVDTWSCSTGSDRYALVDETDSSSGDYLSRTDYIQLDYADMDAGVSQVVFSNDDANAVVSQPNWRRLCIRASAMDNEYSGGSADFKAILIKGGTTYEHSTADTTASLNYYSDLEWIWESPPWSGDEWGAPEDIKFGIRFDSHTGLGSGDYIRVAQCYMEFLGSEDGSQTLTLYPTADWMNRFLLNSKGDTDNLKRWRSIAHDDSNYIYDAAPTGDPGGTIYHCQGHMGGDDRELAGAGDSWLLKVHAVLSLATSGEMEVMGDFTHQGYGDYITPTQTLTQTSETEFVFEQVGPQAPITDWDDTDTISFGVAIDTITTSAEFRIHRLWAEFIRYDGVTRLTHEVELEAETSGRLTHSVEFTPVPDPIPWWDNDYNKRKEITYGTDHDLIHADAVIEVEHECGYEKLMASDAAVNEGLADWANGSCSATNGSSQYMSWCVYHSIQADASTYYAKIVQYNHSTDTTNVYSIGSTGTTYDSHYVPAMCVDSSGYLWVFPGSHGAGVYYWKSTNPYDASAWGSQQTCNSSATASYPHPVALSNGDIAVFVRNSQTGSGDIATEHYGYFLWDDSASSWGGYQEVIDYSDQKYYTGDTTSIYCGGHYVDPDTDRVWMTVTWWEQYGTNNRGRAMSVIYSDDLADWYELTPTYTSGHQIGTADTDPIHYNDAYKIASSSMAAGGPYVYSNTYAMSVTAVDKYPAFIYFEQALGEYLRQPCDVYAAVWDGSTWTNTNLSGISGGAQQINYRCGGDCYFHNGTLWAYIQAVPQDDTKEYWGAELYRYHGSNNGASWAGQYLTQNTGLGIGKMSTNNHVDTGQNRLVWVNRGRNIYLYEDVLYPYAQPDGDDIRVVQQVYDQEAGTWANTEVKRLPDRWNAEDTTVHFPATTVIREDANRKSPYTRDYIYYGNYTETAPIVDGDDVFDLYESWEGATLHATVDGYNGWADNNETNITWVAHNFWNTSVEGTSSYYMVHSGYQFMLTQNSKGANDGTYCYLGQTTTMTGRKATAYMWPEELQGNANSFFGFEVYDSSSTDWFRIGLVGGTPAGVYTWKSGGSKTDESIIADDHQMHKFEIAIDSTNGISAWVNDTLVVNQDSHLTAGTDFRIVNISSNLVAVDGVRIERYYSNPAEPTLGTAEGDDTTVSPAPRVAHDVSMAYFRIKRLAHDLELWYTKTERVAHDVTTEATALNRVAQWLELDASATIRLAHDLTTDKHVKERLAHLLTLEEDDLARVAHEVSLLASATERLANDLELEATALDRLAHLIVLDEALVARVAHLVELERENYSRVAHDLALEFSAKSRLAHEVELEKTIAARVANWLQLEVSAGSRVGHNIALAYFRVHRLAHNLTLDMTEATRVAHNIVGDKHFAARVANLIQLEQDNATRLAHEVELEQDAETRLANWPELEAADIQRLTHWAELSRLDTSRVAHDLETEKHVTDRVAHTLSFEGTHVTRLANWVELEDDGAARLAHWAQLEGMGLTRLAHALVLEQDSRSVLAHTVQLQAQAVTRLAHTVTTDKIVRDRVAHTLQLVSSYEFSRLAHTLELEADGLTRLVHLAVLDASDYERLAHTLAMDKAEVQRMAHTSILEQDAQARLAHDVELMFADATRLAHALALESSQRGRLGMLVSFIAATRQVVISNESLAAVTISNEALAGVTITSEALSAVTISNESLSTVTITNESLTDGVQITGETITS